jgi:hypothetical protein
MPKELFDQTLIESPDSPEDDARFALGKPGVSGALNIAWSYLKQLLQTAVEWLDFTPQSPNPTYSKGRMFYDEDKETMSYYNDVSDVTVNLGQEVLIPVYNNTGSTILNGSVVYLTGVSGGMHTIALADSSDKDKCRQVAVVTHDILNNSSGYATRLGNVSDIDTSSFTGITLYLSSTTPGALTDTKPDDGSYITVIGTVKDVGVTGSVTVDTYTSDITVEVTDTNGFPPEQRDGTTLSFVDGTRTFTITPTGSSFHYYILGDKYEKTTAESVVIDDTSGNCIVYYDDDTLTAVTNATSGQITNIVRTKCIVAYLYWNATDSKLHLLNDERHGISMSPDTHVYLHTTRGIQYLEGLAVGGITIGNGSLDSHAQFGVASGYITDEDLLTVLNTIASTTGLKYFYRSGASGFYTSGTNAGFSFPVGATPLPQYNEFTGATYQLTEVASGNYMLLHIFCTNEINKNPICVLGNNEYSTVSAATIGAETEIGTVLGNVPTPEFLPIATVIIEGKTSFTNTPQARVVQDSNGNDYIDWRTSELKAGSAATSHNNLANLELAATTVTYGHIDDQTQTIAGEKTFSDVFTVGDVFKAGQFTATEASAITAADGDFIYVTSTNATFTSIGFWGYENGTWTKL